MRYLAIALVLLSLSIFGCSNGSGSGVEPAVSEGGYIEASATHNLWGLWQFIADPEAQTLDAMPLRTGGMHLNALPFLEPPPYVYLTVESVTFMGNIIEADIGLRHPYLSQQQFTGFDVCGIFIADGSVSGFEDADIVMAGDADTRLLNPDGYTRWWNPSEFPVNNGTIFSYTDGLLGTPHAIGNFSGTVNAYKYFCDELDIDEPVENVDPTGRGVFSAGQKNVRKYIIEKNSGLVFNYAVDACWKFPMGSSPWDVPDDFSPLANRPEAWRINVIEVSNTLYNDGIISGGDLSLRIDAYDWFDAELNSVKVESPGNFTAATSSSPSGGGIGYSTYEIDITNATPAVDEISLLITVECEKSGYGGLLPGKDIAAYAVVNVPVDDEYVPYEHLGWARHWGGSGDRAFGVAVDGDGNSYTVGYFECWFSDPVDFDPGDGEDPHTSNGDREIFLSKFDTKGNFLWARTWGGSNDDEAHNVCVDGTGDIYVTGFFKGTVDFDPGIDEDIHISSGAEDSFLSKFDPDGNYLWSDTWGGNDSCYVTHHYQNHPYYGDCGFGVAADDSSNIYVVGCGYDGDGFSYLRKYTTGGVYQWQRKWGSSDFDKAFGVAVHGADEIYVVGRFDGTVDFDPGPPIQLLAAHDAHDSYLTKYNSSGEFQWAGGWGGNDKHTGYTDPTSHYSDGAYGVAVDMLGYIYITGEFYGTTDFDPGPGVEQHSDLGPYGYGDAYLTVFDPAGDFLWVRVWGGQHFQKGYGLDVDDSDNIYVAGRFYYTVDFDTGTGVDNHTSQGDCDMYLTKFDTSGDWYWARVWGGTSWEACTSVAIDDDENAYFTGFFRSSPIDFDPGSGVDEHSPNMKEDIHLVKLLPNGYWE